MTDAPHQFIAVEGLSGTGKTTIAQALSKLLKAFYISTPTHIPEDVRSWVDAQKDLQLRFDFYEASVVIASNIIESLLTTQTVICDRYIYTTLAFHAAAGVPTPPVTTYPQLRMPDITFLITCEETIRTERLEKRGLSINDRMEKRLETDTTFLKNYRTFPVVEIDNSAPSIKPALEKIIHTLS